MFLIQAFTKPSGLSTWLSLVRAAELANQFLGIHIRLLISILLVKLLANGILVLAMFWKNI